MERKTSPGKRHYIWLTLNVVACALWLTIASARRAMTAGSCIVNLQAVSTGTLLYTLDHDDQLPPAIAWGDAVISYTAGKKQFACPNIDIEPADGMGHAYSDALSLKKWSSFKDAAHTPMIFDTHLLQWNAHALPNSFATEFKGNSSFLDGSAHPTSVEEMTHPTGFR